MKAQAKRRRNPSVLLSLVAGIFVGALLVCFGGFQYRAVAILRIPDDLNPAIPTSSVGGDAGFEPPRIERDPNQPHLLSIHATATGSAEAGELVRSTAQRFMTQAESLRHAARTTPSEEERVLAEWAEELRIRLHDAQKQVDGAVSALPEADPRTRRDDLLSRWREACSAFQRGRSELERESADLEALRAQPPPTHGIVAAQRRREVLDADAALQQDLRELTVRLAELRSQLLDVWQKTAAPLDLLVRAAQDFSITGNAEAPAGATDAAAAVVAALATDAGNYRGLAATFAENWNREFTALKLREPDPWSDDILDAHPRVRTLCNDFLFAGSNLLTNLRDQIRKLAEGEWDQARHYVRLSNLTRAFENLQSNHHRFEFSAGGLESRENFRLDSALTGARGLRRRSQQQIRQTEQRLQAEALEEAQRQHREQVAARESAIATLRGRLNDSIAEVVKIQDELNLSSGRTEEFLQGTLVAELAGSRSEWTRRDLVKTETKLQRLAESRQAASNRDSIELESCSVDPMPVNLTERLRTGALAAIMTLLVTYGGQWWIIRRDPSEFGSPKRGLRQ